MSTKATLTALINSSIRNKTPLVLKVEHADVEQALVNEVYQTTYNMTVADAPSVISYNLNFRKVGNNIYINGYVKNGNTFMISNIDLLTIGNSLYFAKTGFPADLSMIGTTSLSNGLLKITDGVIKSLTTLGAGTKVIINGTYQTND